MRMRLGEQISGERFGSQWSSAKKRADNFLSSLRKTVTQSVSKSPLEPILNRALTNPNLKDHNDFHTQNVRTHTNFLISGLSAEHKKLITPWLSSIALFSNMHDIDQLLTLQRNEDELRGKNGYASELNAKKGHGKGAATMILTLPEQYAKENNILIDEARRICAGAAIMMFDHENIYAYSEGLRGSTKADGLGVEELNRLLLEGLLDQFSLSPSNIVKLTQQEKSTPNSIGLHPAFEATYSEELNILKENEGPLLPNISDEMREGLQLAADVALAGDILDMVIPPEAALIRTFSTQYSQNRPFHVSGHRDSILDLIRNGKGTGQGQETPYDSDVYRILWQAHHQDTLLLQNPLFRNNEALRNLLVSNALSQIELFKLIGHAVMNGDYNIFDQFADADVVKLVSNFTSKPRTKGGEKLPADAIPRKYTREDIEDFDAICDAVYQDIGEQNPMKIVTIGKELSFEGATSTFHETDEPNRIVKQYHQGDEKGLLWGFIPIRDPEYRAELVASEIAGLGILGQALNAVPAIVRETEGWRHDIGIEMNKLNPESITSQVTSEQYQNIASRIINYHFDAKLCPEVDLEDGETMTTFIRSLLLGGSIQGRDSIPGEVGILRDRLKEDPLYLEKLSSSIGSFLNIFEPTISQFGEKFHEPIMGHGDIKLDNLALVDGDAQMLDVAPWIDWRINGKRMDAAFLRADLLVHKKVEEAEAYWDQYDQLYRQKIGEGGYITQPTEQDLQVIDAISMVYRYMILYRLYKNKAMISQTDSVDRSQYEENTSEARRLLDKEIEKLEAMTGAVERAI